MGSKKKYILFLVSFITIVFFVLFVNLFFINKILHDQKEAFKVELEKIKSDSNDKEEKNFNNKDELVSAVSEALSIIEKKRISDIKDSRYKDFLLAPIDSEKHIYGDPNARFTMIEYSDLECPYCKEFHNTPKDIVDRNQGSINWEFKHKPLAMHGSVALNEAMASECVYDQVGNRGFWVFIDDVFKATRTNGGGVPDLEMIVKGVGADVGVFRSCMKSSKFSLKVQVDIKTAESYGVSGTPATVIVDNKTGKKILVRGAVPLNNMMSAISSLVSKN